MINPYAGYLAGKGIGLGLREEDRSRRESFGGEAAPKLGKPPEPAKPPKNLMPARPEMPEEGIAMKAVGGLGNLLDVPGSMVRDVLTLSNPLDQLLTPFSDKNRTKGADFRKAVVAGDPESTAGKIGAFVGDLGIEIALDPLTYMTFGTSAALKGVGVGAKAARAANKVGLLDDAAKAASKKLNRKVGKREALQNLTVDELLDFNRQANPLRATSTKVSKREKFSRSLDTELRKMNKKKADQIRKEIGSEKLAEGAVNFKLPGNLVNFTFGGEKTARAMDTIGEAVRYSAPIRATASVMSKNMKGQTTKKGQIAAAETAAAIAEDSATAKYRMAKPLLNIGKVMPKDMPQEERARLGGLMYQYLEDVGRDGVSIQKGLRPDGKEAIVGKTFDEAAESFSARDEFKDLRDLGVMEDLNIIKDEYKIALDAAQGSGVAVEHLDDLFISYAARARNAAETPMKRAASKSTYNPKSEFAIKREDYLRNIPGGTARIQEISLDSPANGGFAGLLEHRKRLGQKTTPAEMEDLKKAFAERYPDIPEKQAGDLFKSIAERPLSQVEASRPMFLENPAEAAVRAVSNLYQTAGEARGLSQFVKQNAKLPDTIQSARLKSELAGTKFAATAQDRELNETVVDVFHDMVANNREGFGGIDPMSKWQVTNAADAGKPYYNRKGGGGGGGGDLGGGGGDLGGGGGDLGGGGGGGGGGAGPMGAAPGGIQDAVQTEEDALKALEYALRGSEPIEDKAEVAELIDKIKGLRKTRKNPEAAGDLGDLGGAAEAISDNFYEGILESIKSKGRVPSAERNSSVGRLWDQLKGSVTPEEFIERLKNPSASKPSILDQIKELGGDTEALSKKADEVEAMYPEVFKEGVQADAPNVLDPVTGAKIGELDLSSYDSIRGAIKKLESARDAGDEGAQYFIDYLKLKHGMLTEAEQQAGTGLLKATVESIDAMKRTAKENRYRELRELDPEKYPQMVRSNENYRAAFIRAAEEGDLVMVNASKYNSNRVHNPSKDRIAAEQVDDVVEETVEASPATGKLDDSDPDVTTNTGPEPPPFGQVDDAIIAINKLSPANIESRYFTLSRRLPGQYGKVAIGRDDYDEILKERLIDAAEKGYIKGTGKDVASQSTALTDRVPKVKTRPSSAEKRKHGSPATKKSKASEEKRVLDPEADYEAASVSELKAFFNKPKSRNGKVLSGRYRQLTRLFGEALYPSSFNTRSRKPRDFHAPLQQALERGHLVKDPDYDTLIVRPLALKKATESRVDQFVSEAGDNWRDAMDPLLRKLNKQHASGATSLYPDELLGKNAVKEDMISALKKAANNNHLAMTTSFNKTLVVQDIAQGILKSVDPAVLEAEKRLVKRDMMIEYVETLPDGQEVSPEILAILTNLAGTNPALLKILDSFTGTVTDVDSAVAKLSDDAVEAAARSEDAIDPQRQADLADEFADAAENAIDELDRVRLKTLIGVLRSASPEKYPRAEHKLNASTEVLKSQIKKAYENGDIVADDQGFVHLADNITDAVEDATEGAKEGSTVREVRKKVSRKELVDKEAARLGVIALNYPRFYEEELEDLGDLLTILRQGNDKMKKIAKQLTKRRDNKKESVEKIFEMGMQSVAKLSIEEVADELAGYVAMEGRDVPEVTADMVEYIFGRGSNAADSTPRYIASFFLHQNMEKFSEMPALRKGDNRYVEMVELYSGKIHPDDITRMDGKPTRQQQKLANTAKHSAKRRAEQQAKFENHPLHRGGADSGKVRQEARSARPEAGNLAKYKMYTESFNLDKDFTPQAHRGIMDLESERRAKFAEYMDRDQRFDFNAMPNEDAREYLRLTGDIEVLQEFVDSPESHDLKLMAAEILGLDEKLYYAPRLQKGTGVIVPKILEDIARQTRREAKPGEIGGGLRGVAPLKYIGMQLYDKDPPQWALDARDRLLEGAAHTEDQQELAIWMVANDRRHKFGSNVTGVLKDVPVATIRHIEANEAVPFLVTSSKDIFPEEDAVRILQLMANNPGGKDLRQIVEGYRAGELSGGLVTGLELKSGSSTTPEMLKLGEKLGLVWDSKAHQASPRNYNDQWKTDTVNALVKKLKEEGSRAPVSEAVEVAPAPATRTPVTSIPPSAPPASGRSVSPLEQGTSASARSSAGDDVLSRKKDLVRKEYLEAYTHAEKTGDFEELMPAEVQFAMNMLGDEQGRPISVDEAIDFLVEQKAADDQLGYIELAQAIHRPVGIAAPRSGMSAESSLAQAIDEAVGDSYSPLTTRASADLLDYLEPKVGATLQELFEGSNAPGIERIRQAASQNGGEQQLIQAIKEYDETVLQLNAAASSLLKPSEADALMSAARIEKPAIGQLGDSHMSSTMRQKSSQLRQEGNVHTAVIVNALGSPLSDRTGMFLGSIDPDNYVLPQVIGRAANQLRRIPYEEEYGYRTLEHLLSEEPAVFARMVGDLQAVAGRDTSLKFGNVAKPHSKLPDSLLDAKGNPVPDTSGAYAPNQYVQQLADLSIRNPNAEVYIDDLARLGISETEARFVGVEDFFADGQPKTVKQLHEHMEKRSPVITERYGDRESVYRAGRADQPYVEVHASIGPEAAHAVGSIGSTTDARVLRIQDKSATDPSALLAAHVRLAESAAGNGMDAAVFSSQEAAQRVADMLGLDPDNAVYAVEGTSDVAVRLDGVRPHSETLFQAANSDTAKASITVQFGPDGTPDTWWQSQIRSNIQAFDKADGRSFAHEVGHLMQYTMRALGSDNADKVDELLAKMVMRDPRFDVDPAKLMRPDGSLNYDYPPKQRQGVVLGNEEHEYNMKEYFADFIMDYMQGRHDKRDEGAKTVFNLFKNYTASLWSKFKGTPAEERITDELTTFLDELIGPNNFYMAGPTNIAQVLDGAKYSSVRLMNKIADDIGDEQMSQAEDIILARRASYRYGGELSDDSSEIQNILGEAKQRKRAVADEFMLENNRAPSRFELASAMKGAKYDDVDLSVSVKDMLSEFRINDDVVSDIRKISREARDILDNNSTIVALWDGIMNTFKTNVTATNPGFHVRNGVSGFLQNALNDIYDPNPRRSSLSDLPFKFSFVPGMKRYLAPYGDATTVMLGRNIKHLAEDAPMLGFSKGADEEATNELVRLAVAHGIMESPGQQYDLIGASAQAVSDTIPGGDRLNKNGGIFRLWLDRGSRNAPSKKSEKLNPFKVAGGFSGEDKFFAARYGRAAGDIVEAGHRLGGFTALIKQGYSPSEAAKRIKLLHVDYGNLSQAERQVLRRVFPFYSYARGMSEYVVKELATRPGGKVAQTVRAANIGRQQDPTMPDHVSKGLSIPLGSSEDGSKTYLTGINLMHEQPVGLIDSMLGGPQEGLFELGSQLAPPIKAAMELATNRSMFLSGPDGGRSLDSLDPPTGRMLSNVTNTLGLTDRKDPYRIPGGKVSEVALSNSPLSRYLHTVRTLTDDRKTIGQKASSSLFGAKVNTISPAAQDAVLRERASALMRDLGGKVFTRSYIDDETLAAMSPEQRGKAEQYMEIMRVLGQRTKARKAIDEMHQAQETN